MGLLVFLLFVGIPLLLVALGRLRDRIADLEKDVAALRLLLAERAPQAELVAEASAPLPREPVQAQSPPHTLPFTSPHGDAAGERESETDPADNGLATLFERFVGGRLLIWIGGIALAVSGVFLVRYSIETGLVGPRVRMIMAALFGLLLVGAGEGARRRTDPDDPRIAQALVGAGIFVLYAATYGSHHLHGLVSLGAASILMALITAGALGLALRHGAPTAVMGLVGGFLTPLLVGDPESSAIPLIAYLALLNVALFGLAYRRGWTWLAAGAVLLSFLWTGYLLFAGPSDALAAGAFILLIGLAGSLMNPGPGRHLKLIFPAAIGLVQLAALVGRTDLGLSAWALFGSLSLGCLVLAALRPENRPLPVLALLLALVLLAGKAFGPDETFMPAVAAAITLLFGAFGSAFAARRRDPLLWTVVSCGAMAGPVLIMRMAEPQLMQPAQWGVLMAALAINPAALVWLQRSAASAKSIAIPLLVAASSTALLLAVTIGDWLPGAYEPAGWLVIGIGAAIVARRLDDRGLAFLAIAAGLLGALGAAVRVGELWAVLQLSIFGSVALATALPPPVDALRLHLLPAALLLLLWRLLPAGQERLRPAALIPAAVLASGGAYILYKQVFALGSAADFEARGFAERLLLTQTLFAAGWLASTGRLGETLKPAALLLTTIAAARFVWFDLLIHNPALVAQRVGSLPILNLLLAGYWGAAAWLYLARRRAARVAEKGTWLGLFLAALIAGSVLLVRQLFQGTVLSGAGVPTGEDYGRSLAGLLLSIALMAAGVKLPDRALRVAGLALLTATILKVFLLDASELEGVLRILSFLGLGVALIGIGKLYGQVLAPRRDAVPAQR
jgi:uncharacterized membrane protein